MEPFRITVAVYGSATVEQDSSVAKKAERLGRMLAEAKFAVSNGAYTGVMEACSRGAHSAQGEIIGVACATFTTRTPNPHLTRIIDTQDLTERITTLMRVSDAYVVLDGGIGTLAELFLAWNLIVTGWKKPVLVVGSALRNAIHALQQYTEIGEKHLAFLTFVENETAAVNWLKNHFELA